MDPLLVEYRLQPKKPLGQRRSLGLYFTFRSVTMNEEWTFEQRWPESMRLPRNNTKGAYLLEAYGGRHNKSCNALIVGAVTNMTLARVTTLTLDIDVSN